MDPFTKWVDEHPWTVTYIAVVVTIVLGLQVYEVFFR